MVISNQTVKVSIIETEKNPAIPETKPVVNIQENNISPVITEIPVKPNITQNTIRIGVIETPIQVSIPIGVKGDKGDAGSSTEIISTAGTILGGNRAVIIDNDLVYYADYTTLSHRHKIAGITTHSAIQGAEIIIQASGEMTEPSWNWETGKPIFVGGNGYLTQVVPSSGFQLEIASPLSSTKIFIEKKIPIIK